MAKCTYEGKTFGLLGWCWMPTTNNISINIQQYPLVICNSTQLLEIANLHQFTDEFPKDSPTNGPGPLVPQPPWPATESIVEVWHLSCGKLRRVWTSGFRGCQEEKTETRFAALPYTLWWTYKKLLKMAIEIVGFPIKNGDFPLLC